MYRSLYLFITILVVSATSLAQELPRWSVPSNIQVFVSSQFDSKERDRINSVIQSWRPLLPEGLTLISAGASDQTCQGCVTIIREATLGKQRGETEFAHHTWITSFAIIRIDPRVSGDDLEQAVKHELGHALGLKHRANSVMAPTTRHSTHVLFWSTEKRYRPDLRDAEQLRAIYSRPIVTQTEQAPTPEADAPLEPSPVLVLAPPKEALRYSFRRVVTDGKKRRESTFTFNDRGEQIETEIRGSNDKRLRSVPMFPVGTTEAVFAHWRSNPAVHQYDLTWDDGKELSVDGAGDQGLLFPDEAFNGKIRVKFSNYRLFRTSVSIKEVQ